MITSHGRGMGALEQPDDPRDYDAAGIIEQLSLPTPKEIDLSAHLPAIADQGATQSCVGFAVATAAYMRASIARTPNIRLPSATALYALGRAKAVASASAPLVDAGSQPRLVLEAAATWGLVADASWPFRPDTINTRPSWSALDSGVGFELHDYSWINSTGFSRTSDLKVALANGYPVVISVSVDDLIDTPPENFIIDGPKGDIRGNHMLAVIGYRDTASGTLFRFVNSWGSGWGDDGKAWLTEARMMDSSTRNIAVIRTVPGESL